MENKEFNIPPNEEHLEALEETIDRLESSIKKNQELLDRHSKITTELKEVHQILDGLYKKIKQLEYEHEYLSSRDQKTEEYYASLISRSEHIIAILDQIEKLEIEFANLIQKAKKIEEEFEEEAD